MLGIEDKWVALAYALCICSTLLCVVYAWRNWNRGEAEVQAEDLQWAAEEDHVEEKF